MNHISQSKAQRYLPATAEASIAAGTFIEAANKWGESYKTAKSDLSQFLKDNFKASARGFLASDALNMSTFGVMFDESPGPGFIAVPSVVAERLSDLGLRGNGYFPDVNTALGKKAMEKLNAVSRAAEQRPLLNSVSGVKSVAIQDGRVVLSRASLTDAGITVFAAPAALSPNAELTLIGDHKKTAGVDKVEAPAPSSRSTPRPRF